MGFGPNTRPNKAAPRSSFCERVIQIKNGDNLIISHFTHHFLYNQILDCGLL